MIFQSPTLHVLRVNTLGCHFETPTKPSFKTSYQIVKEAKIYIPTWSSLPLSSPMHKNCSHCQHYYIFAILKSAPLLSIPPQFYFVRKES